MCQASQGSAWWDAFQLSSGKEHGVYLSAGIYLGKQENILPPNLIGPGILLSPPMAETMQAIATHFGSVGSPGSRVRVSAKHAADRVSE